jgi:hypothetical protein
VILRTKERGIPSKFNSMFKASVRESFKSIPEMEKDSVVQYFISCDINLGLMKFVNLDCLTKMGQVFSI